MAHQDEIPSLLVLIIQKYLYAMFTLKAKISQEVQNVKSTTSINATSYCQLFKQRKARVKIE